jgi:hypothetical protein
MGLWWILDGVGRGARGWAVIVGSVTWFLTRWRLRISRALLSRAAFNVVVEDLLHPAIREFDCELLAVDGRDDAVAELRM